MTSTARFKAGEKVLCYHHSLIYDSKCLQVEQKGGLVKYLVHYDGWNKNWNEWVDESRILHYNPANQARQKHLREVLSKEKGKVHKKIQPTIIENDQSGTNEKAEMELTSEAKEIKEGMPMLPYSDDDVPIHATLKPNQPIAPHPMTQLPISDKVTTANLTGRRKGKKIRLDDTATKSDAIIKDVKLNFAPNLKVQLVDDCEYVTSLLKLVELPRHPCVSEILSDYCRQCLPQNRGEARSVMSGIESLFEASLGPILLYRLERWQYRNQLDRKPPLPLAKIYGAEHLLRLLVKIPELINEISQGDENTNCILHHVDGLLTYLSSKASDLFTMEYTTPPL
eukprot:Ihof_evm2s361 gene=Ihof_evmTU2s361